MFSFWQPLRNTFYRHPELQQFYQAVAVAGRNQYASAAGLVITTVAKAFAVAQFFMGPLVAVTIAALPMLLRNRRQRRLLIASSAVALANFLGTFLQVHYTAPAAAALVVLSCASLRSFCWLLRRRGHTIGLYLVPAMCILVSLSFVAVQLPDALAGTPSRLAGNVIETLVRSAGKHLVFVRYGPNHQALDDVWIYNRADIPTAPIIWARDMGAEKNRRLLQDYPGRKIWLLEPDQIPLKMLKYTF